MIPVERHFSETKSHKSLSFGTRLPLGCPLTCMPRVKKGFWSRMRSLFSTRLYSLSASCRDRDCREDGSVRCITRQDVGSSRDA